ncbi:MAG TPA: hypothetical protein VGR71_05025 [Nitrospira sp.]|nr:hypothetical protein [Nitrospira sp.]
MLPILVCVLSLILFFGPVGIAGIVERARRHLAEKEFGFWDHNVLAAMDGSVIQ